MGAGAYLVERPAAPAWCPPLDPAWGRPLTSASSDPVHLKEVMVKIQTEFCETVYLSGQI